MAGLIHIYCGDGKGKTTAATGLAIRGAGAGKQVVFAQFLKSGTSSELVVLKQIPGIQVLHMEKSYGFWKKMTPEQREETTVFSGQLLAQAMAAAQSADILILDEVISACNHGAVAEQRLLRFLREKPEKLEVVMTGRAPSRSLQETADYITQMQKIKHPFDRGIRARRGIEF